MQDRARSRSPEPAEASPTVPSRSSQRRPRWPRLAGSGRWASSPSSLSDWLQIGSPTLPATRGQLKPCSVGVSNPLQHHPPSARRWWGFGQLDRRPLYSRGVLYMEVRASTRRRPLPVSSVPYRILFESRASSRACSSASKRRVAGGLRLCLVRGAGASRKSRCAGVQDVSRSRWATETFLGSPPGPCLSGGVEEELAIDGVARTHDRDEFAALDRHESCSACTSVGPDP